MAIIHVNGLFQKEPQPIEPLLGATNLKMDNPSLSNNEEMDCESPSASATKEGGKLNEDWPDIHHRRIMPLKVTQKWEPFKEKELRHVSISMVSGSSMKKKDDGEEVASRRDTHSKVSSNGKTFEEVIVESSKDDDSEGKNGSSKESGAPRTTSSKQ